MGLSLEGSCSVQKQNKNKMKKKKVKVFPAKSDPMILTVMGVQVNANQLSSI